MTTTGPRYAWIDLNRPEEWPTEVWTAFERAQHERLAAQVTVTDDRRHDGNRLVNPGFQYQDALKALEDRRRAFDTDRDGALEVIQPDDDHVPFPLDHSQRLTSEEVRARIGKPFPVDSNTLLS